MTTAERFRPSWDDYFMAITRIVATRATCDRLSAGALLVKGQRIISTGYNGAPPGLVHCDNQGHLLENEHCVRTIHAEHNAILQAAVTGGASTSGSTLYTLYSPCIHCAKYIATAGITRVVVGKIYRNGGVGDYLHAAGIKFDLYAATPQWYNFLSQLFNSEIAEQHAPQVKLTEK